MWYWGLAALVALLWPDRISGPLHGLPLDGLVDVIVIAVALPLLWTLHSRFLKTRVARGLIVALLAWKGFSTAALVQDGWCVRVQPSRPYAQDAAGAPHSWDIRADWRSPDPACSALMTRPYRDLHEFPVWFFNLPPPNNNLPEKEDVPPGAHVAMTVQGFLYTPRPGLLEIASSDDVAATLHADGVEVGGAVIGRGLHAIVIDSTMTGDRWALIPRFDGADVWSGATPTVKRPSKLDLFVRPWGAWLTVLLAGGLMLTWATAAVIAIDCAPLLAWSLTASVIAGVWGAHTADGWPRWAIAALACAILLSLPRRLQNLRGALLSVGIPWLVIVVVRSAPLVGQLRLYSPGDDFWEFQRFAYRIVMLGYWLEGGSPTFWFQPLYRWTAGILHLVFGDSSIGESLWDGASTLIGALAAFKITRPFAGYRWAILAATLSLTVFTLSSAHTWLGVGLGEISAAGLLYLAVCLVAGHRGRVRTVLAAGLLATLGFYTRLNHFIMAAGVAIFALPLQVAASDLFRPHRWLRRISWRSAIGVMSVIGAGLLLLAWRTWHYTGVFSIFYGTQRDMLATAQPGLPWTIVWRRMLSSVMMVLTINDPARFDPIALPLLTGIAAALLSLTGFPRLRRLPLAIALFGLASVAGALFARGAAYVGRFSVHAIPITSALTICALAALTGTSRSAHKPPPRA